MWYRRKQTLQMRTVVGVVELEVWYGKDPQSGHWGCPMRQRWGLEAYQQMSPALEERVAFMATVTFSYEAAAQAVRKWGCPMDSAVIHAIVQRRGKKAEQQSQQRLKQLPVDKEPQRATELGVLMIDGWYARFRGEGWGKKKSKKDRVEWHEIKTGLFYRQDQAARTQSDRGIICAKAVVRWQGEPLEFGQRLGWEALRGGIGRARDLVAVGDGARWIWNLVQDRWGQAQQVLDFWHGSQHLWELGRAYCGNDELQSKKWVEKRLHQLRHGKEKTVLKELAQLKAPRGPRGKILRKEQNYFREQAPRMHYQELCERGWPIGSGAVESQCNQAQGRFKRSGQFWTQRGFRHLSALDEAWLNGHWDQIWLNA